MANICSGGDGDSLLNLRQKRSYPEELEKKYRKIYSSEPFRYESGPRGALEYGAPPRADRVQSLELVRHRKGLAMEQPDAQTPYLTGRYEYCERDNNNKEEAFTLMVNQAGSHVELWLARVLRAASNARPLKEVIDRYSGTRTGDGPFRLWSFGKRGKIVGSLSKKARAGEAGGAVVTLEITVAGKSGFQGKVAFRRVSIVPVLSDAVLAALPKYPELTLPERTPLLQADVQWLGKQLAFERVDEFIQKFFSTGKAGPVMDNNQRCRTAKEFDDGLALTFSTVPGGHGLEGWHIEHIPLVEAYARCILAAQVSKVGNGSPHTQLDHLQEVANQVAEYSISRPKKGGKDPYELTNIENHLKLKGAPATNTSATSTPSTDASTIQHRYRFTLKLGEPKAKTWNKKIVKRIVHILSTKRITGAIEKVLPEWAKKIPLVDLLKIIEFGGEAGDLTIEKTAPNKWSQLYTVLFAHASVSYKHSAAKETKGEFNTTSDWGQKDFLGQCELFWAGAYAKGDVSVGPVGHGGDVKYTPQLLQVYGDKTKKPLQLESGASVAADHGWKKGKGGEEVKREVAWGAGWGAMLGAILEDEGIEENPVDPRAIVDNYDYSRHDDYKNHTHYGIDDALLTEDEREKLRFMLANELRFFSDETCRLGIVGHTDRRATDEYNMDLSCLRAWNVYVAIKDILGENLRIPAEETHLFWMGEAEACMEGELDKTLNARRRRVEIMVNHRLVLKLFSEDQGYPHSSKIGSR